MGSHLPLAAISTCSTGRVGTFTRLRVCKVQFDELFHRELLVLGLAQVELGQLLLLPLHHSLELLL